MESDFSYNKTNKNIFRYLLKKYAEKLSYWKRSLSKIKFPIDLTHILYSVSKERTTETLFTLCYISRIVHALLSTGFCFYDNMLFSLTQTHYSY